MRRCLSPILVALALLMQIGAGVLPAGSNCPCTSSRAKVPACCAHKTAPARSCCKHTCPHPDDGCLCTPTAGNPVVPTVQPRTVSVPVEVVAAPIITPRPVLVLLPRSRVPAAPSAHESPPGLPRAVNLPLLL